MDILLLVAGGAGAVGVDWPGDFSMTYDGRLQAREPRHVAPFVYTGVGIIKPQLFAGETAEAFRLAPFFHAAAANGRLYGVRLDGLWVHVGQPGEHCGSGNRYRPFDSLRIGPCPTCGIYVARRLRQIHRMIAMPITDFVCARTEHGPKERAAAALADMGFSLSDTIRMLMVGAGEEWFPLDLDATNASPTRPLYEFEGRQARAFASIDNFMADLRGYDD